MADNIEELLSLYIDGELDDKTKASIENELNQSTALQEELDSLRKTLDMLRELPALELPEGFHEEAMSRIREQRIEKSEPEIFNIKNYSWRKYVNVAASVLVTLVAIGAVTVGLDNLLLKKNAGTASQNAQIMESRMMDTGADTATGKKEAGTGEQFVINDTAAPEAFSAPQPTMVAPKKSMAGSDKTIKVYEIVIQTGNFDYTMAVIDSLAGYNITSNINANTFNKNAAIARAVPDLDFYTVLNALRSTGEVLNEGGSEHSVVMDIADAQARYNAKALEYDRLMALLSKANNVENMLKVENRLGAVISEMEDSRTQINYFNGEATTPIINISVYGEAEAVADDVEETFSEKIGAAFILSVNGIIAVMEVVMILVSYLFVPALVFGAVGFCGWLVYRKVKKRGDGDEK